MSRLVDDFQYRMKGASTGLAVFAFRAATALILGLTFALIFQVMIGYQMLGFSFVIVAVTMAFLRISRAWGGVAILVFNLICVLIALLLRMYILVAPGA